MKMEETTEGMSVGKRERKKFSHLTMSAFPVCECVSQQKVCMYVVCTLSDSFQPVTSTWKNCFHKWGIPL